MSVYLDLWLILSGALAGVVAAYAAKGRNALLKAAILGAVVVVLVDLARVLL